MSRDINALVDLARVRSLTRSGVARSIRLAAGLSLREVAETVGVGLTTVWRWEAGDGPGGRTPGNTEAARRYGRLLEELLAQQQPGRRGNRI